ncbi:hypothetical protein ACFFX0_01375 [Citricoccus parietis]|uniref:Uncharacterized protein n=1 Tax=Citricoccus parietis TaxID=592307 RepID=A0ABV5FTC2_9MICC
MTWRRSSTAASSARGFRVMTGTHSGPRERTASRAAATAFSPSNRIPPPRLINTYLRDESNPRSAQASSRLRRSSGPVRVTGLT